jgi:hypothetical protein
MLNESPRRPGRRPGHRPGVVGRVIGATILCLIGVAIMIGLLTLVGYAVKALATAWGWM